MIPRVTSELGTVSTLDDRPNDTSGLTAAELKAKFDADSGTLKAYLNDVLIPFLESMTAAASLGIATIPGFSAGNIQTALEQIVQAMQDVTQGSVTDGSITLAKLATEVTAVALGGAAASHTHGAGDINSGVLNAARLPVLDGTKLGAGSVGAAQLGAAVVTSDKLAALSVLATHIAQNAVTAQKLAPEAVTRAKMAIDAFTLADNAGAHNAIYRGKNLGSAVTAAQWAAIQAGTFEDLFIGDYWTINGVNWRIAAFDYYYNTGDVLCTTHHVVIVPEASLYETAMNSSQSTAGGYVASTMYTSGLAAALATVKSAFGDNHILTHRQIFCNAVTNGISSGYGFYDNQIALMTEQNVFGGKFYGAAKTSTQAPSLMTLDNAQYPLFAHNHALINVPDKWVGLRDVVSATSYARVTSRGSPDYTANITNPIAVRPAFSIKA